MSCPFKLVSQPEISSPNTFSAVHPGIGLVLPNCGRCGLRSGLQCGRALLWMLTYRSPELSNTSSCSYFPLSLFLNSSCECQSPKDRREASRGHILQLQAWDIPFYLSLGNLLVYCQFQDFYFYSTKC